MYQNCSHNYNENKQTKRFMNKLLASLFKGLISREAIQKLMLNSFKLKIVLSGHHIISVFRRVVGVIDFSRSVILTEIVGFLWENLDSTSSLTPSSDTYPY